MDHVLIPIDFSESSINAMHYGLFLARKMDVNVTLMHTITNPVSDPLSPVYQQDQYTAVQESEKAARGKLENLVAEMKRDEDRIIIDQVTPVGFPGDEILREASQDGKRLIVMGTKGTNERTDALLGSTTKKVVDNAHSNVLVVPRDVSPKPFDKVAYSTDHHEKDPEAVAQLKELVDRFQAELHVVHVQEGKSDDQDTRHALGKALEERSDISNVTFHQINDEKGVEEALESFVQEAGIGLLAMLNRNLNFFERIFDPSMARKMAYQSEVPLLIFHFED